MRQEPGVNTLHVKSVATFWQQPELVLRLKLTQTNGTVKGVLLESYDGLVEEHREGVNEGLVNPSIMEVEELLQLALESSDIVQFIRLSSLGSPQESNQKVQQTRNEENNGQNYDDQKDAWTNLQGPIVETETIRSNSSSGWEWWVWL